MGSLVSVIVPNFQHARFLDMRLQSILKQTYQDFELIILDDCSQDDGASRAIIESYRSDPHVSHIVYNEVNSGSPFKQWRKGLELAKGDYVWIAESDDFCLPTLLETLYDACIKNDAVFAFCRSSSINERGDIINSDSYLNESVVLPGLDFIRRYLFTVNSVSNASAVLFKRVIAIDANRQYEEMKGCGDWLFWIELAESGTVCYVNKALNCFRQHDDSVTRKNTATGNNEKEDLFIFNYLKKTIPVSVFKEIRIRFRRVRHITLANYEDNSIKIKYLNLWDPHFLYRLFLPPYILYGNIKMAVKCLLHIGPKFNYKKSLVVKK